MRLVWGLGIGDEPLNLNRTVSPMSATGTFGYFDHDRLFGDLLDCCKPGGLAVCDLDVFEIVLVFGVVRR